MPVYYEKPVQNKLSGLNTLAYMGVDASTPPQFYIGKRAPTVNDYDGWRIGSLWLLKGTDSIWMLVDKDKKNAPPSGPARWIAFGGGVAQFTTDNGVAYPLAGNVNMLGGTNMHTEAVAPSADQVVMHLVDHPTIGALTISSLATPGVIMSDGAGLLNATTGIDGQIIVSRPAGPGPVWADLFSSDGTVLINASVDPLHPNGINLRSVGGGGGGGTAGLTADDTNTATPNAITHNIKVIGSDVIKTLVSAPDELTIDIEDSPVAGNILFGGGAGNPSGWGSITSTGGSVTIAVNAGLKTINLEAAGVAALTNLDTDAGMTAPIAGVSIIHGVAPVTTSGAGNVVSVALTDPGVDGQVLISSSAGAPAWASIVGAGGITVTPGPNSITLTGGGGGGGGGIITLDLDSGVASDPGTHVVYVEGKLGTTNINHTTYPYKNIYTSATLADPDLVSISLASSIQLPLTTVDAQAGVIMLGTHNFMHAYGTENTFLGRVAGRTNAAVVTGTAIRNTSVGARSYNSFTTGHNNSFFGYLSGTAITTGNYNVGIGSQALYSATTSSANIAVGYNALAAITTATGGNVAIGSSAMANTTTLASSVAIGCYAMGNGVATGSKNVAIGYQAMDSATSATNDVIIGYQAGGSILSASNSVGIGSLSLQGLTSGGTSVAIGNQSLANVNTGTNNIAIGYQSGTSISGAQSNSISIGSSGLVGGGAISIGTAGTHTACYLAGVYTKTLGSTRHSVWVDSAGKLGQGYGPGEVLMSAYLAGSLTNATGDGTVYYLGNTAAGGTALMALETNHGGGAFVTGGLGVPARYTFPVSGSYLISITVKFNGLRAPFVLPPPPPPVASNDPVVMECTGSSAVSYKFYPSLRYDGFTPFQSASFSAITYRQVGDHLKWYIEIDYRPGESVGGGWPLTYNQRSKTIGLEADKTFTYVGVTLLEAY